MYLCIKNKNKTLHKYTYKSKNKTGFGLLSFELSVKRMTNRHCNGNCSSSLNTNNGILIYGKYGIIINKNIINYNDKLIFKILTVILRYYHHHQSLHMVLIVIMI